MLNGNLHYPLSSDVDKPLNETVSDKIRDYRADYKTVPVTLFFFIPAVATPLGTINVSL